MASAPDKSRNKAIQDAAKALAAAAKSLAAAAEALNILYEDDEEPSGDNGTASNGHKSNIVPPGGSSVINYEDSDDEYMEKAREQVRVEAASWNWKHDPVDLDSIGGPTRGVVRHHGFSSTPPTPQLKTEDKTAATHTNTIASSNMTNPNGESLTPEGSNPSYTEGTTAASSSQRHVTAAPPVRGLGRAAFTSPVRTWAGATNLANVWATAPVHFGNFVSPAPLNGSVDDWDASSMGVENPIARAPFQNLIKRWPQPTNLQKEILESIRTDQDTLVCYGRMKSSTHAILVHCMETLAALPEAFPPEGVISALIIVPQQTTGRLWLNLANELFPDFGMPHKAMLLPGGNSDLITESERMASERIDILISSPRVFINHVNNNPALRTHLARLRFIIFPEAHELTKKDEFLNFQFNMLKKRLQTRAKSPRQIIIATSTSNDQIKTFATRAFAPNSALVVSSSSSDDPLDIEWNELLQHQTTTWD